MPGRPWTDEEETMLKARYQNDKASMVVLQHELGRSKMAIMHKAMSFGLTVKRSPVWSEAEDAILRDEYPKGEHKTLASRLGRSEIAIGVRATRIGVQVSPEAFSKKMSQVRGFGEDNIRFTGCGRVCGWYVSKLKDRGKDCSVTAFYLNSIATDVCPLSGRVLVYRTRRGIKDATASLDRIDPSKGYVEGNVRWVHKGVNMMKWDMCDEEFLHWIDLIDKRCQDEISPIDGPIGTQPNYCIPKHGGNGFSGYGRVMGSYLGKIRAGARKRHMEHAFLLEPDTVRYLDSIIPEVCPFSGEPLTFPSSSAHRFTTASLDRIDPDRGYEKDNVRWIHRAVNLMKLNLADEEFLSLVRDIARYSL